MEESLIQQEIRRTGRPRGPGTGVDYQDVEDLSDSSSMAWIQ